MNEADDLIAAWMATVTRAGAEPHPALAQNLLARYAEPHRHYHTVAHLTSVLSTVEVLVSHADDADLVRLAVWFHDAIYDPRRVDNEERSARLAESELATAGLPASTAAAVARLVRLTADHEAAAGDVDGEALCDADLAVLATPAPAYDDYVAAVRREYAHVDELDWRAGRCAVLHSLVARPRLFRTEAGQTWERDARDNVSRELVALADPSGGAARLR